MTRPIYIDKRRPERAGYRRSRPWYTFDRLLGRLLWLAFGVALVGAFGVLVGVVVGCDTSTTKSPVYCALSCPHSEIVIWQAGACHCTNRERFSSVYDGIRITIEPEEPQP